ncbi:MFS transporter [Streptantibioticus parmotrematis]|uniref:MFS transporter n=1 Tax=Streptantibioticus parmotrematis TaxID=2873249 RepID=UPI00340E8E76
MPRLRGDVERVVRGDVERVVRGDVERVVRGDVARLWGAYAVSAAGSAVGMGALPLVALLALRVSAFQVSLLTALSAVASAAVALPVGARVEFRRKRPVMITADLVCCAALGSVPVAAACGVLTYAQLCVVGVVRTAAGIAFDAASGAHLKALVAREDRARVNGLFATTNWITQSAGPPLGGLVVGVLGATATMAVDAASFLGSALGVRRLRRPEPPPPARSGPSVGDITSGWTYVLRHRVLRALFCNAMLFGGSVMTASPLMAVLMLRDLGLGAWQYGLALGVPCLGGVLGSRLSAALTRRYGQRRLLLLAGAARTPWLLLLPLAPRGPAGVLAVVAADFGLLVVAGIFNPAFGTYRMEATEDGHMTRVTTAWSVSSRATQAAFMAAGGALAGLLGVRGALVVAGGLCVASAGFLPWGGGWEAEAVTTSA